MRAGKRLWGNLFFPSTVPYEPQPSDHFGATHFRTQGWGARNKAYARGKCLPNYKVENLAQLRVVISGDHMVNLLDVEVWESGITVTLPGTSYWATYIKQNDSSGLFARVIADKDDPRVGMTLLEFLDKAWKLANERAMELGWPI